MAAVATSAILGCSATDMPQSNDRAAAAYPTATPTGVVPVGTGAMPPTGAGGATAVPGSGPVGAGGAGTATGGSAQSTAGSDWCAVSGILASNCQKCHGSEPAFGAPMPLVTRDDLLANAPIAGRPVYQVALERVADDQRPMPPTPNPRLSGTDIATLQAWIDSGAPSASCDTGSGTGATVGAGGAGVGAGGTTEGTGGGTGPDPGPDPNCIDCGDYSCTDGTPVRFQAHGQPAPGDMTPFDASQIGASGNPNSYECFYFKAPWGATTQSIGHKPIIDNTRVLHHWLLYASAEAPPDMTDGGHLSHCQLQSDPNRVLLAGWAPGTPGMNMPENVGDDLPLGSNTYVTLEIHYFNTNPGAPANDNSGVELCLTDQPRQYEAAQHWLGTEKINVPPAAEVTTGDTCTPNLTAGQTSTLLSVTPHMHFIGTHAKLELIRSNGQVETLHDEPFAFDNQQTYFFDQPVTVYPGDQLRASCTYRNTTNATVMYGEGSDEEMCYLFTQAYPAGSLYNGRNGCLGPLCIPGGTHRCIDNENILDAAGAL